MILCWICYYYTCAITIGRQEGGPLSVPKCPGISLWPLLSKYSSFSTGSPALQGRRVWDRGMEQSLGERRLWGWAGTMQGWGGGGFRSEGAGYPPTGLQGDAKAQGVMGESWAARNTEPSLPALGSGTGAQTSQEIERWGRAVMKCPSEAGQRHPEEAGLWRGRGLRGVEITAPSVMPRCRPG